MMNIFFVNRKTLLSRRWALPQVGKIVFLFHTFPKLPRLRTGLSHVGFDFFCNGHKKITSIRGGKKLTYFRCAWCRNTWGKNRWLTMFFHWRTWFWQNIPIWHRYSSWNCWLAQSCLSGQNLAHRNCISSSNHRSAYGRQFSGEFTKVEKVLRIAGPSLRGSCNDDVVSRAGAEIQKRLLGGMIKQRNMMMRQNDLKFLQSRSFNTFLINNSA